MQYCTICDEDFSNIDKHIYEKHSPKTEDTNIGDIICPLCKIGVKNLYRHQFSEIHRANASRDAIPFKRLRVNDFIKHFEMLKFNRNEVLKNKDDPFWTTAKEELDEEEFAKLQTKISEISAISQTI